MKNSQLDFLKEHFSQLNIELYNKDEEEWAIIRHPESDKYIYVGYYPEDDLTPYVVSFSTCHCHVCSPEDVIEEVEDYTEGPVAAIEFYDQGSPKFGGTIDPSIIHSGDFEGLCKWFRCTFGVFKPLRFEMTAWDVSLDCSGYFEKDEDGKVQIILDMEST